LRILEWGYRKIQRRDNQADEGGDAKIEQRPFDSAKS
jgi:hypothetical protein